MLEGTSLTDRVYAEILRLPCFDYRTPLEDLPRSGLYVVFEPAEIVRWRAKMVSRPVRVGINTVDGRLRQRMSKHYGNPNAPGGERRQSVFRRHVGGALLRKENPENPQLEHWLGGHGQFPDLEARVSTWLREHTCFRCIRVDSAEERCDLEKGLIALFAQLPLGKPSAEWLGRHAANSNVRESGLWNSDHVDGEPLTEEEFFLLKQRIQETLEEYGAR